MWMIMRNPISAVPIPTGARSGEKGFAKMGAMLAWKIVWRHGRPRLTIHIVDYKDANEEE